MTLKEKILYHQIHPLKLTADSGCEPVSLYFFWRHDLVLGLATHFVPPIAASLILICGGDLETIKRSKAGKYLQRHMTRTVEGIRFAGDIVMVFGAWFHQPALIVAGLAVVVIAWCGGWFGQMLES
jgi:hypothetical protein